MTQKKSPDPIRIYKPSWAVAAALQSQGVARLAIWQWNYFAG